MKNTSSYAANSQRHGRKGRHLFDGSSYAHNGYMPFSTSTSGEGENSSGNNTDSGSGELSHPETGDSSTETKKKRSSVTKMSVTYVLLPDGTVVSGEKVKAPKAPKAVKEPKAPKAPKPVKEPKAPKAPKAVKEPKAPKAVKEPKAVKAPKAPKAPKVAKVVLVVDKDPK